MKSSKCIFKENRIDHIHNGLFLGDVSCNDEELLRTYNIKHIIRIMEYSPPKFQGITTLHLNIKDKETCEMDLTNHFKNICFYIHKKLRDGDNVLVHCKRGHHRSAIFVVAVLMKYYGWTFEESVNYIQRFRPCALQRSKCLLKSLEKFVGEDRNRKYYYIYKLTRG